MTVPATTGSLKTRVEDMEIGDYIVCNYKGYENGVLGPLYGLGVKFGEEVDPENPEDGGYFYLIKVDRGKLVADRVVHTNSQYSRDKVNKYRYLAEVNSNSNGGPIRSTAPQSIAVPPDNQIIAVATQSAPYLQIYSLKNYETTLLPELIDSPVGLLSSVLFTKDGNTLIASRNASGVTTQSLYVYRRYQDQFVLDKEIDHLHSIRSMDLSDDGNYLILTDTSSNRFSVYGISEGNLLLIEQSVVLANNYEVTKLSPNGEYVVFGYNNRYLNIYEFNQGVVGSQVVSHYVDTYMNISYIDISPDGTHILIGKDSQYTSATRTVYELLRVDDPGNIRELRRIDIETRTTDYDMRVEFLSNDEYMIMSQDLGFRTYQIHNDTVYTTRSGDTPSFGSRIAAKYIKELDAFIVVRDTSPYLVILSSMYMRNTIPSGGVSYSSSSNLPTDEISIYGSYPTTNDFDNLILNFPIENVLEGRTHMEVFNLKVANTLVRDEYGLAIDHQDGKTTKRYSGVVDESGSIVIDLNGSSELVIYSLNDMFRLSNYSEGSNSGSFLDSNDYDLVKGSYSNYTNYRRFEDYPIIKLTGLSGGIITLTNSISSANLIVFSTDKPVGYRPLVEYNE